MKLKEYGPARRGIVNETGPRAGKLKHCMNTERTKKQMQAHGLVQKALKHGEIVRQGCAVCGGTALAHHEDYDKPLDVIWLCRSHHMNRHSEIEEHTDYGIWRFIGAQRPVTKWIMGPGFRRVPAVADKAEKYDALTAEIRRRAADAVPPEKEGVKLRYEDGYWDALVELVDHIAAGQPATGAAA